MCVFKRRHEVWRSNDDSVQVTHFKTAKLAWLSNCDFPEIEKSNASTVPWIAQASVKSVSMSYLDNWVFISGTICRDQSICFPSTERWGVFQIYFYFLYSIWDSVFFKFSLTGGQHTISSFHKGSTGGNAPWPWGRPNGELMWTDNRGSEHLVGYYR